MPFVAQYQPLVSIIKDVLMKKWNLIQNQPLPCQNFKEPPIISYKKGVSWRRTCLLEPKHERDRCAACHPLQFFNKNNLSIQKARVQ